MAKITRKLMKMFGSAAGANEISQFGSLAAAAPAYVNDGNPDTIQGLSAWVNGWYSAVVGGNSPAIQDMNALLYVFAYQLCYLFQAGVSEWNSATTYYVGSLANDGAGQVYVSLQNDNLNHALTETAWWAIAVPSPAPTSITSAESPVTVAVTGAVYNVSTQTGTVSFQLPAASAGFFFTVKDVGGILDSVPVTILRAASESIEGYAANYTLAAPYGSWTFRCDGTNWYVQ